MDCDLRNLHPQSTFTASTRWKTFSDDFVCFTYPARMAITAQEPAMATVNQTIPLSGQPNRFSFHMETMRRSGRGIQSTEAQSYYCEVRLHCLSRFCWRVK